MTSSEQIDGQMDIYDYLPDPNKVLPVDVMGLLDDAYCPRCGYCIPDRYIDEPKCPSCGQPIDWKPWHDANDEEMKQWMQK